MESHGRGAVDGRRLLLLAASTSLTFLVVTASIARDQPSAGRQLVQQRNLVGRVEEFEGELGYHVKDKTRSHPERIRLANYPLGFPLDTALLPNIMMGYYDRLKGPNPKAFDPFRHLARHPSASGGSSGGSSGAGDASSLVKLACHGPPCPSFGPCSGEFPNIQACWNEHLVDEEEKDITPPVNCPLKSSAEGEGAAAARGGKARGVLDYNETCSHKQDFSPHDASALQLFRVESVFVTFDGLVVNRSHAFVKNGCRRWWRKANYGPEHRVQHVAGAAFNWASVPAANFYHFMIELLPLFLVALPLMPSPLRDVPWLVREGQWPLYEQLGAPIIGIEPSAIRLLPMVENDLFYADVLFQPMFQDCDHPSRPLWRLLRRHHLLHPTGLPLFNPDWTYRAQPPLTALQAQELPSNWVILLARRPEGKRRFLVNYKEVEAEVMRVFGPERVVIFEGSLPILEARALFRRTRLFIASHGASLTNMIFMPEGTTVLEIRPHECFVTVFHLLANACSLSYHVVFSKGNWSSNSVADVPEVTRALEDIQTIFLEEDRGLG
ncbi:unnamed protein product [Closterium sp. Yama58-4]|nr:unnamed protein product [Closterium sp. Yama58-4]